MTALVEGSTDNWSTSDIQRIYFHIEPGFFPQDLPSKALCIPSSPSSDMVIGFENPRDYTTDESYPQSELSYPPVQDCCLSTRTWLTEISHTPTVRESISEDCLADFDHFPRIISTFFQIQWLKELHLSPCCNGRSTWDVCVTQSGVGEPAFNESARLYSGWSRWT